MLLVIISIYFQYYGAFYEFLDGAILFNVWYIDRGQSSFISHFLAPIRVIVYGYRTMRIPIFIGFIIIGYIYFWRLSQYQSFRDGLVKDAFSPVLLSFPAPVVWSLLDFQGSPDFFVLLPYIAIGFAYFLDLPFEQAKKLIEKMRNRTLYKAVSLFIALGLCITFIVSGIHTSRRHKFDFYYQKQLALDIENRFGKEVKLISIGLPQLLVLLHRKKPTRYVFIINGIDRYIHANTPGGFEGWLMELEAYRPDVIALGPTQGIHISKLMHWLKSRYYQEQIGPYGLYVRNPGDH